jgi:hypothetical protein
MNAEELMDQPSVLLANRRRQTLPARQALAERFSSTAEKSKHFRELARKSHECRVTLSGDEAAALVEAYELLGKITERTRSKVSTE